MWKWLGLLSSEKRFLSVWSCVLARNRYCLVLPLGHVIRQFHQPMLSSKNARMGHELVMGWPLPMLRVGFSCLTMPDACRTPLAPLRLQASSPVFEEVEENSPFPGHSFAHIKLGKIFCIFFEIANRYDDRTSLQLRITVSLRFSIALPIAI